MPVRIAPFGCWIVVPISLREGGNAPATQADVAQQHKLKIMRRMFAEGTSKEWTMITGWICSAWRVHPVAPAPHATPICGKGEPFLERRDLDPPTDWPRPG